jgi:geranylgeranyl pyrophosphate synthase
MFGNNNSSKPVIPFAAAVELLHNMTLVHDDIEDNSDDRRGKRCLHRYYGVPLAINTADFMAIKVFEMITSQSIDGEMRLLLMQKVIERIIQMLHGQAIEIETRHSTNFDMETAIEIIKCKTSALIILSTEIGTIIGGGSDIQLNLIQRYAGYVGLAFQITDDVLNLVADKKYGKEIGGDLREGKRTAIVGHFMSSASEIDKARFLKFFGKKNVAMRQINIEISLLNKYGSIDHAKKLAAFYLKCGLYYLQFLPDNNARTSLIKLSRFLTDRNW